MRSVLIISLTYSLTQHLKLLLQRHSQRYTLVGTADNSVLGMSMIESFQPDIVIMPTYMTFWNAEDLINYLLPGGSAPQFILLQEESEPPLSGTAATQVAATLPEGLVTEAQLLRALEAVEDKLGRELSSGGHLPYRPGIQHSLEVMELLSGLLPPRIGAAQRQFGRLRVGQADCWLLVGAPWQAEESPFHFFSQSGDLEYVFEKLSRILAPLGKSELCIYRESNLCILLADGQSAEPDWWEVCARINGFLQEVGIPPLLFEISDVPLPLERWHNECHGLLQLRQNRFFYSPPYLQPKLLRAFRRPVTQGQIHDKLSALSLALQNRKQEDAAAALQALESLVCHSLSKDLYAYVTVQLLMLYNRLQYRYGNPAAETEFRFSQFPNVSVAFEAFRASFQSLFQEMTDARGSGNQIIAEACGYISQHLADSLSLEDLARHVHVSATYLSRLFKRETGCTLNAYISQHRVLRAIQLLETSYKIIDIAGMVGFESSKYFSQVFRKQVGKTPQEYRRELRGEEKK